MPTDPSIVTAFRQTRYRVSYARERLTVLIDQPCPPLLEPWLRGHAGCTPGWLITAHNGDAQPLETGLNDARQRVLRDWVTGHGYPYLPTVHEDPGGRWPDEPGLLIAGIEQGLVRALGRRFRQLALVALPMEANAELVWLD